jgi:hypothetical protein
MANSKENNVIVGAARIFPRRAATAKSLFSGGGGGGVTRIFAYVQVTFEPFKNIFIHRSRVVGILKHKWRHKLSERSYGINTRNWGISFLTQFQFFQKSRDGTDA